MKPITWMVFGWADNELWDPGLNREALNTGAETLAEVLSLIERLAHIPTGGNDDDHI